MSPRTYCRVASIRGWYGDTWTAPEFEWSRRSCTAGLLRVPVHTSAELFAGIVQRIAVSGITTPFTVLLPATGARTITVHLRPRAGRCRVRFDVTPARKPPNDPRTLGVVADGFEYVAAGG